MLGGAQRAGLHNGDEIADTGLVVLVVDLDLLGTTEDLAVQGVLVALLDEVETAPDAAASHPGGCGVGVVGCYR